jgi:uncharacterized protein YpiB (UPF0302 family)
MEEKITNLRLKFDGFMKNKESALIVRKEAYLVLDEAHQMGRNDIADMLIDLESSLGENKCNCSRNCKC